MNKRTSRIAAFAVIGSVVLGGISMAQSASADTMPGTITLYGQSDGLHPKSGTPITSGDATADPMFWGFGTSVGCPVGYQKSSNTLIFQNNVFNGAISSARTASTTAYGQTGLDGNPMAMDDSYNAGAKLNFVANKALAAIATPVTAGPFELRVYCFAGVSPDFVNDKFMTLPLVMSSNLATWSTPVAATATTTALTAAADQATKKITLTGTVKKPDSTTATSATGRCDFYDAANALVGSGTVTNGVASFTTGALAAGDYTYTAKFVSSSAAYGDSSSGTSSATVLGDNQAPVAMTVVIPRGVGAVSLTGVQTAVNLGSATLIGSVLTASAPLGNFTVTDGRQTDAAAWSLTGVTSDFVDSTTPSKIISGSYLGWAPALSGSANAGTAGATVAPATVSGTGGLRSAANLATGSAARGTTTTVGAQLTLAVPRNTPGGTYNATLTITLV